jgi:hypothetical protein
MASMYLRELQDGAGSGPYKAMIEMMRKSGATVPPIFYLFAFKPAATGHLSRFTQEVMRGPSPLSPGIRELIAAFTSCENHCPF